MSSSKRIVSALSLGLLVSLSLFYLMSQLISQEKKMTKSDDGENFIDFVRTKRVSHTEVKKRELPKKPEIKENITPKQSFVSNQDNKPNRPSDMKFDSPKLNIPLAAGTGGPGFESGGGAGYAGASKNSDATPTVRIQPPTPPEAAMKGIVGWIRIQIDIAPDGTVENPKVLESSHPGLYDQVTLKTVLKWRYRPKVVEGKAVKQTGIKFRIDFDLE
jgi:periplasmic protein TonB